MKPSRGWTPPRAAAPDDVGMGLAFQAVRARLRIGPYPHPREIVEIAIRTYRDWLPPSPSTPPGGRDQMLERLDASARRLIEGAIEIAAERRRQKLGLQPDEFVTDVRVTVADMRRAARPVSQGSSQSTFTDALNARVFGTAPSEGPITAAHIEKAIK